MTDTGPQPPDPLLLRIFESWKADGANVTLETRDDGTHFIQIHPPGWLPDLRVALDEETEQGHYCPICGVDRPDEPHLDWCTYDGPEPE